MAEGTTAALLAALRNHYIGPEALPGGVFLTEVQIPDDKAVRRADALYLSFLRSAGVGIDVCEIKATRADFLRELAQPRKAEAWWNYSSRWWIVSPHPDVTPVAMLPEGWGLMCPPKRGRRFTIHHPAAVRVPQVDLVMLIEIAKRMDTVRAHEVWAAVRAAETAARDQMAEAASRAYEERRAHGLSPEQRERLTALDKVETQLGMTLGRHTSVYSNQLGADQFAAALRLAAAAVTARDEVRHNLRGLRRQADSLHQLAGQLGQDVAAAVTAHEALNAGLVPNA